MKLTNLSSRHSEFKFAFMFTSKADHRKELILTVPYFELAVGFDW